MLSEWIKCLSNLIKTPYVCYLVLQLSSSKGIYLNECVTLLPSSAHCDDGQQLRWIMLDIKSLPFVSWWSNMLHCKFIRVSGCPLQRKLLPTWSHLCSWNPPWQWLVCICMSCIPNYFVCGCVHACTRSRIHIICNRGIESTQIILWSRITIA